MSGGCSSCGGRLDVAAVLCDSTRCTDCERKVIAYAADPWRFFLRVLRSKVRPDGTVHVNDCREALRGRIEPKQIGQMWRRAKSLGLLAPIPGPAGWEPSKDEQGGNTDKQARIWAAGPQLRERVAA